MPENPLRYPKSSKAFDAALFCNPSSEYRGAPLWSWNTKLRPEQLRRQIDGFKTMGMGGFHMHSRVGLDTEYLGSEFMEMVKLCTEYAREEGLLACLYDEDRWPSGCAGGLVTKQNPDLQSQHILLTQHKYGQGDVHEPPAFLGFAARSERGKLIARYAIDLGDNGALRTYQRLPDNVDSCPDGFKMVYAYLEPNAPSDWYNGSTYVDTLNPSAIQQFIETTHERYKAAVGNDFGAVVPSIFTDEPQFAQKTQLPTANSSADQFLPWTFTFCESFASAFGYDPLDKLPEVVWNLGNNQASLMRYQYHDHVCELFVSAFMDQLSAWCRGNGILLTGHMMEEPFLKTQTASLGEAMRCYRSLDMPGIDLLCDQFEYNTAKQATSVARQNGTAGAMSEIYGVTNWTFTFEGHKGCGDWQAALGITWRVHHLTPLTMRGEAKRDFPAAIGYQSPWFDQYSYIEDYFARVNVALTRGKARTRVAVIHPIESYWLCYGPVDTSGGELEFREQCHRDLSHWLLHGLIDFDFISESLLPQQNDEEAITSSRLAVGACEYEAVIVPNLRTIRSTTLRRLQKFAKAGGKVIILGSAPQLVDAVESARDVAIDGALAVPWTRFHLLNALDDLRDIAVIDLSTGILTDRLLYQMRTDGDDAYLFICNTARDERFRTKVAIRGQWKVIGLDAFAGGSTEFAVHHSKGWTEFHHVFEGTSSLLLQLTPGTPPSSTGVTSALSLREAYGKLVSNVALRSVQLSEPNVLLLDYAEWKLGDDRDWNPRQEVLRIENIVRGRLQLPLKLDGTRQPWSIDEEDRKPKARLTLRIRFKSTEDIAQSALALEDAEQVHIVFNGQRISSQPTGWWVDESIQTIPLPAFPAGHQTLELTYPFGVLTNIERVYILGSFTVDVRGNDASIVSSSCPSETLSFGDITRQGLPFYAGNVTYTCSFEVAGQEPQELALSVPNFVSPVLSIRLDNESPRPLYLEPRMLELGLVSPGHHTVDITVYGNRNNAFGAVHLTEDVTTWVGPSEFRTDRPGWWQDEYNIQRIGLLGAPKVMGLGRDEVTVQPHILRFKYERAKQRH